MNRRSAGYTLVEVVIAAGLLVMVLVGGAAMSLTLVTQEEMNTRIARVQNHQEQLARLYQLGLSPAACNGLVPAEPALTGNPVWTDPPVVVAIPNVGDVEQVVITVTYRPNATTTAWAAGTWTAGDSTVMRTRVIEAYRPTTR